MYSAFSHVPEEWSKDASFCFLFYACLLLKSIVKKHKHAPQVFVTHFKFTSMSSGYIHCMAFHKNERKDFKGLFANSKKHQQELTAFFQGKNKNETEV